VYHRPQDERREIVIGALTEVAPEIDPVAIDPDTDLAARDFPR
jgi:hypothetical protein